jgi:hypothetical protein
VSEDRAAEIAREQANIAIREFSAEADSIATSRIGHLDQMVVHELSKQGLLQAFSDPAFLILLRKAQLQAASTSDDNDHELLSKLLVERAQQPIKPMHLMITRSVELIEYLDHEALIGMTVLFFMFIILPAGPEPKTALKGLDDLAANLLDGPLPPGMNWLNRLDVLGCIHYQPGFAMKSWDVTLFTSRPGYVTEGILPDDFDGVASRLAAIHPELASLLVPHPFLPGRMRINTGSSAQLIGQMGESLRQLGKTKDFEAILMDSRVDEANNDAIANMFKFIESDLTHLQAMRAWWNNIKGIIQPTPVGLTVGYSNARRFDQLDGLGSLAAIIGT